MSKDTTLTQKQIENRIFTFRNNQVMIDRDLAEMYQVETKVLNQAVKRNILRFPDSFRFELNDNEKKELVTNCDRFKSLKHSSSNPYAFTEQGVAMLSAVLRSDVAIKVSIQIMNAFVQMRQLVGQKTIQDLRFSNIENKLIAHDQKFQQLFSALEKNELPKRGIFFDGQVFDAYELTSKIIRSAKKSIVLIDNYINESTLTHLAKKDERVSVTLLTKKINDELRLDVRKANQQYKNFNLKQFDRSHDRFLIIDEKDVYHLGASLKDLGVKWFAFSKMDSKSVLSILKEIKK